MLNTLLFLRNRLAERLWLKPLLMCLLSFLGTTGAYIAGTWFEPGDVPEISTDTLKVLLGVLTSGMLVIATFAVGAMISAYASASRTATPRAFSLIIADDVTQNALSTFVGAFLFAVIALLAVMNGLYAVPARFFLLVLTLAVFWIVVMTFIRWVDRIARLGRLGMTLDKVEHATRLSIQHYQAAAFGRVAETRGQGSTTDLRKERIGYLQRVDWDALQQLAERVEAKIKVHALPGAFITPEKVLATLSRSSGEELPDKELRRFRRAFLIGDQRLFDEDPRFGFIVLSEIASRALSPAVNDPGTAIQITGRLVRLFHNWRHPDKQSEAYEERRYDRIEAPRIRVEDLFEDAFVGISRDGAGFREVMIRLQKAFHAIGALDADMARVARHHAGQSLLRAKEAMPFEPDYEAVKAAHDGYGQ